MRSRREYRGLQVLLPYLAIFEREGYSHGSWVTTAGGWETLDFSPPTESFFHSLHDEGVVYQFDWVAWQGDAERLYQDPDALAEADAPTLRKLLTLHARKDRFCEGHLAAMLEEGHITAILRQVARLAERDGIVM